MWLPYLARLILEATKIGPWSGLVQLSRRDVASWPFSFYIDHASEQMSITSEKWGKCDAIRFERCPKWSEDALGRCDFISRLCIRFCKLWSLCSGYIWSFSSRSERFSFLLQTEKTTEISKIRCMDSSGQNTDYKQPLFIDSWTV